MSLCEALRGGLLRLGFCCFLIFKQKTAYEMRISDWSSDVCSSDLGRTAPRTRRRARVRLPPHLDGTTPARPVGSPLLPPRAEHRHPRIAGRCRVQLWRERHARHRLLPTRRTRSEEHTSELQSLMRISYAVFCWKKKKHNNIEQTTY